MLGRTPSQTVGPFFAILVPARTRGRLAGPDTPGQRITVETTVRDGTGGAVSDALVEVWQANTWGHCNHPEDPRSRRPDTAFDGFGRVRTGADGRFLLETIKPGAVPGPDDEMQAPHLVVGLFARGLLTRLVTRVYFGDEPTNADDPILARVAPDRRSTLVARHHDAGRYHHAIALQGPSETVFFEV